MVSESEMAREKVGVSDQDTHDIWQAARRRRLVMVLAGGVGTVAAMIAGFLTAIHLFNESNIGNTDSYPFIPPMAAISAAAQSRPKLGVVGIVAVVCAAFVMMFVLTAAAYTTTRTVTLYGVWHR